MEEYDVIICGAGAGGIAAAYALKNSGLKVLIIDKNPRLGGTHVNAWVNVSAPTPAPPFYEKLVTELIENGKAKYVNNRYQEIEDINNILYTDTFFRSIHRIDNRKEIGIFFDPDSMADKYLEDLGSDIKIRLKTMIVEVTSDEERITSIGVIDRNKDASNEKVEYLKAKMFLDCTADDVLIRKIGKQVLLGEEYNEFFKEQYGFIEESAPLKNQYDTDKKDNLLFVNRMELIYRIKGQKVILDDFGQDEGFYYRLPYSNISDEYVYINSCSGFGHEGREVITAGEDEVYNEFVGEINKDWPEVQKKGINSQGGEIKGYHAGALAKKELDSYAPMLGIRESYRIYAERMLGEPDLYNRISSLKMKEKKGLDAYIACGNHLADIQGSTHVNLKNINEHIQPYGVPYGCLIPKGLKNVLVASRGAGFTHIAASSFRLNKDIMQIGWAAGHACRLFENDFKEINVEKLQDKEYTDFLDTIKKIENFIKE